MSASERRYVALLKSDGTEVSGVGYTRQATMFEIVSDGVARNKSPVLFAAGGAWGCVTKFALADSVAGPLLLDGDLNGAGWDIRRDDTLEFESGCMEVKGPVGDIARLCIPGPESPNWQRDRTEYIRRRLAENEGKRESGLNHWDPEG